jgi:hypothetical protein
MTKKLKNYDAKLKAEVALEAHKGEKSLVEICAAHNLPKKQYQRLGKRLK